MKQPHRRQRFTSVITAVGLASVLAGMEKGVKRLSYANIVLAVALLLFVLMAGATMDTMRSIVESVGGYVNQLPTLAFFNDTFGGGTWSGDWTVFYWAWTVTWSPFIGLFVARISRGRTVREFVFGVLLAPSLFTVIWFAIFGWQAMAIDGLGEAARAAMGPAAGSISNAVSESVPLAMFAFFAELPWAPLMQGLAVLVVATPCPLILAVPVALVAGLSRAAHFGVLVKGARPLEAMARHGILIDGEGMVDGGETRILLQIFSKTVIGPIFFEFIQRKGDDGFGEGNFRALFESIEEDQIRRGVLKATPA